MLNGRNWPGSTRALIACVMLVWTIPLFAADPLTDTPMPAVPTPCDIEWERIKGIPPLPKSKYDAWIKRPEAGTLWPGYFKVLGIDDSDMYYYMARLPFVIGAERSPSIEQREEWLQRAAVTGHKAARAALMRLWYYGVTDMDWLTKGQGPKPIDSPRASREEYLKAAREAAEAGDPEFASVMMDTATNFNGFLHCQSADKDKPGDHTCNPQNVTKPIETRKWAEIAGMGGNPNAMALMCSMYVNGSRPQWGYERSEDKAFPWCFAQETTSCRDGRLLEGMYRHGRGTAKDVEAAEALRSKHPAPASRKKEFNFPLTSR
ncbi:MAG: hypothetical protein ABI702_02210 [Burkholderiales bacterium]